jgi:hypothetical protein
MSTWFATACVASTPVTFLLARWWSCEHDNSRDPGWMPPTAPVGMGFGGGGRLTHHRKCSDCDREVSAPSLRAVRVALAEHRCVRVPLRKLPVARFYADKPVITPPDVSWIEFGRGKGKYDNRWRRTIHGIR